MLNVQVFPLNEHLYFAPKPKKTPLNIWLNHTFHKAIMYFKTSEQQLFESNLGCYLHNFQYQMRCYGCIFNPLSANFTKWSNTLELFVGCCQQIVWVCLTIMWDLRFKGIVKWAEPCKCVILLISRILCYKRSNPFLKEWRFWYSILTGNFLP